MVGSIADCTWSRVKVVFVIEAYFYILLNWVLYSREDSQLTQITKIKEKYEYGLYKDVSRKFLFNDDWKRFKRMYHR